MSTALNRRTRELHENVDLADYPEADFVHNPDLSAVLGKPVHLWVITGDVITLLTQEVMEARAAARIPKQLAGAKGGRIEAIDKRTEELIKEGFDFGGKIFSLSLESQANIHGIYTARALPEVTYPIRWLTKDDLNYVDLEDADHVSDFFLAALGTIRARKDSGSALKEQVLAATTLAEVEAITDTR